MAWCDREILPVTQWLCTFWWPGTCLAVQMHSFCLDHTTAQPFAFKFFLRVAKLVQSDTPAGPAALAIGIAYAAVIQLCYLTLIACCPVECATQL